MNDEMLEMLDDRGRVASVALDEAVASVDVPAFQASARPRNGRRSWLLAVAAAVVFAALAVATVDSDDNEESLIADSPAVTQLILPNPHRYGFSLGDVWDRMHEQPDALVVTVQSPVGSEQPWRSAVVEWSAPSDPSDLLRNGEPVDIGGPPAAFGPRASIPTLTWFDGDQVRHLAASSLDRNELAALAARTAASNTSAGTALPGYEILHRGPRSELSFFADRPRPGTSGVSYAHPDRFLFIETRPGSVQSWRAASVLASHVEETTVRGQRAQVAQFVWSNVVQVSWLESDGTLVTASAIEDSAAFNPDAGVFDDDTWGLRELPPLTDSLEAISDDEFRNLFKPDESGTTDDALRSLTPLLLEDSDVLAVAPHLTNKRSYSTGKSYGQIRDIELAGPTEGGTAGVVRQWSQDWSAARPGEAFTVVSAVIEFPSAAAADRAAESVLALIPVTVTEFNTSGVRGRLTAPEDGFSNGVGVTTDGRRLLSVQVSFVGEGDAARFTELLKALGASTS